MNPIDILNKLLKEKAISNEEYNILLIALKNNNENNFSLKSNNGSVNYSKFGC